MPLTRTDPLVGTTAFEHDAFNRRTRVVDPNNVAASTDYDLLNRTLESRQEDTLPTSDLVTTYEYTVFKDLFRTTLPEGNLIEYGYDTAGRLISVERKPNAVTPGERMFYTLDDAGSRTKEERQSWNGSAWATASSTEYQYLKRC